MIAEARPKVYEDSKWELFQAITGVIFAPFVLQDESVIREDKLTQINLYKTSKNAKKWFEFYLKIGLFVTTQSKNYLPKIIDNFQKYLEMFAYITWRDWI